MDFNMIRPRKCKPAPPPPPPAPAPSPKMEAPPSPKCGEPCPHECCSHARLPPFLPSQPSSFWPCQLPPLSRHIRGHCDVDMEQFSRMRGVDSHGMGYRLNFRDPFDNFYEDHILSRCTAFQPLPRHALPPPPMLGHHHGPPPSLVGHHYGQPPPLFEHHHGPPIPYYPPMGHHEYQQGYYGYDNPNGCTVM